MVKLIFSISLIILSSSRFLVNLSDIFFYPKHLKVSLSMSNEIDIVLFGTVPAVTDRDFFRLISVPIRVWNFNRYVFFY